MANKKVGIDRLQPVIQGILRDYGDEVAQHTGEIVKKVSAQGARALREQSGITFKTHSTEKPYYKGWRSKYADNARTKQGIIYNKDVPGLPHLLEYGHANVNGGRTPGRVHIKPIEDAIVSEFLDKIRSEL